MNPLDVLQPNYLGDMLENSGVGTLALNQGLGVAESQAPAMQQRDTKSSPAAERDRLRIAKAREFGLTKETVGF